MFHDAYTLEQLLERQKSLNFWIIVVTLLAIVTVIGGLMQHLLLFITIVLVCMLVYLVLSHYRVAILIDEVLHRMDFSLMQFEDISTRDLVEKKLTKLFGNIPQRITSNSEMARTRGGDEKGPTWGQQDGELGDVANYRDAIEQGKVFDGLEGELSVGEKMLRNADENYSQMSQKRWDTSQRNDPDLIEAGVETLAELVTTDYFEKNSKDGAVDELMGQNSE